MLQEEKLQKCASGLDISLRNRISPADAEGFCCDSQYWWRLPTFVLVEFDPPYHPFYRFRVEPLGYYLLYGKALFDVFRQNSVQDLVGRQSVLVGLIGPQLCRGSRVSACSGIQPCSSLSLWES